MSRPIRPSDVLRRDHPGASSWLRGALFALMALGLGYPALNRYDPRRSSVDSDDYLTLVEKGPGSIQGRRATRLLVPMLARPVYLAARGRIGTWDPAVFALLVVNAGLVALGALAVAALARRVGAGEPAALVSSLLYLLDFHVANAHLAAMVDAGEALGLAALTLCAFTGRWALVVPVGLLGALTKETFVPLSAGLLGGWLLTGRRSRGAILAAAGMIAVELAAVAGLRTWVGGAVLPWEIATSEWEGSLAGGLWGELANRGTWFGLVWLLPLGIAGARRIPREWIAAALGGAGAALLAGAWNHAGPNVGRALFSTLGPLLAVGSACWLVGEARVRE